MVQNIEGVAFSTNEFYDGLHFLTIANKLKAVQGGLKWLTLTKNRPVREINIKLRGKTKAMNDKTFFGVLVFCPSAGSSNQLMAVSDTTDVTHVYAQVRVRYNEWNAEFNHKKV